MAWLPQLLCFVPLLAPPQSAGVATPTSQIVALEPQFDALAERFRAECRALNKAKNQPNSSFEPPELVAKYGSLIRPIADAGHAPASAWLLHHYAHDPADPRTDAEIKRELYERFLPAQAAAPWLTDDELDVLDSLRADAGALGPTATSEFALAIFRAAPPVEVELRARSLRTAADALASFGEPDAGRRKLAAELWTSVRDADPRGPLAPLCDNALWRLRNLVVGAPLPNFAAVDVDGNEIQLADFHGKVIVVGFFSFERTGDRVRAQQLHKLASLFQNEPFVLLGVNQDPKSTLFRKLWEDLDLRFPCVFEGGRQGRVASAWHLDAPPKNLVIDRAGRLRYVDLEPEALQRVVLELVAGSAPADPTSQPSTTRR